MWISHNGKIACDDPSWGDWNVVHPRLCEHPRPNWLQHRHHGLWIWKMARTALMPSQRKMDDVDIVWQFWCSRSVWSFFWLLRCSALIHHTSFTPCTCLKLLSAVFFAVRRRSFGAVHGYMSKDRGKSWVTSRCSWFVDQVQIAGVLDLLDLMTHQQLTPDVITFSAAISALGSDSQHWYFSLRLLDDMAGREVMPNQVSFGAAMSACEKLGIIFVMWVKILDHVS